MERIAQSVGQSHIDTLAMLPFNTLLPIRMLVVTLECKENTQLRYFHQSAVTAFLRHLLHSPQDYDRFLIVDTPESGREFYYKGQSYCFTVIALAGGEYLIEKLISALTALPKSAPITDSAVGFRDNWRCLQLQDAFTGQSITTVADLSEYTLESLHYEAGKWSNYSELGWHWLSPVRLLKQKKQREKANGEARYCHVADDLHADLLLSRVYDTTADLLRRRGERTPARPQSPATLLLEKRVQWVNNEYCNREGAIKVMGGLLGSFTWQIPVGFADSWYLLVVLGQYIGIGQRRSFGWGRYRLTLSTEEICLAR